MIGGVKLLGRVGLLFASLASVETLEIMIEESIFGRKLARQGYDGLIVLYSIYFSYYPGIGTT